MGMATFTPTASPTDTPMGMATFTPTDTPTEGVISADFDESGQVDSVDLLMLLRNLESQDMRYDLNLDGEINWKDLMVFTQWWCDSV